MIADIFKFYCFAEPGILQFKKRGFLVKESCGNAVIPVIRKNGADGIVSAKWKTIDQTAVNTRDFDGGEGVITFQHAEIEKNIEIPIFDDFNPEKDEHFELELFEPKGGAVVGQLSRTTVTIANDDGKFSLHFVVIELCDHFKDACSNVRGHYLTTFTERLYVNNR